MRAMYGLVLAVLVCAGCGGEDPTIPTPNVEQEQTTGSVDACKTEIASQLRNPDSAQYRNITTHIDLLADAGTGYATVRGEINGTNGFGGYNGYKPFTCVVRAASGIYTVTDTTNTP